MAIAELLDLERYQNWDLMGLNGKHSRGIELKLQKTWGNCAKKCVRKKWILGSEPTNFRGNFQQEMGPGWENNYLGLSQQGNSPISPLCNCHGMECDGINFGFWQTAWTILSWWVVAYWGLHDALLLLLRPRQHAKQAWIVQVTSTWLCLKKACPQIWWSIIVILAAIPIFK